MDSQCAIFPSGGITARSCARPTYISVVPRAAMAHTNVDPDRCFRVPCTTDRSAHRPLHLGGRRASLILGSQFL